MERREPGQALRIAETLNPADLPKVSRYALYFVEVGPAYASSATTARHFTPC
ncbi:hypothetical protein ACFV4K_18190 [Nocardia sp. NPDC059764]|uniref:hypothetical protein n=1 Tax=Nocardia sp. NPDC059764 TaxID=3346939 RepID=UPI00364B7EA1